MVFRKRDITGEFAIQQNIDISKTYRYGATRYRRISHCIIRYEFHIDIFDTISVYRIFASTSAAILHDSGQEVKVAVYEAGYTLIKVYELHHFEETVRFNRQTCEHGLFDEAVRTFAKDKIVASGFPAGVVTEQDKEANCAGWRDSLDIVISPDEVKDSPGKRFCAKIAITLLWGRRSTAKSTRYMELMVGKNYQPKKVRFVTSQVAEVVCKEEKEITRQRQDKHLRGYSHH
ncbi:hypothetical protein RvY_19164 [Ramazzottius varieornatus]|uniref:Uncharacterized protein n=1 Tax=Ramazzottius varieornatus TaxID=947166 RepID=A0A1D1W8G1_RAMVA|nr:hypothetical protein RvY_19164 [Ramazzottius varieornatus]